MTNEELFLIRNDLSEELRSAGMDSLDDVIFKYQHLYPGVNFDRPFVFNSYVFPSLAESIVSSNRQRLIINTFRNPNVSNTIEGVLVGGSASYGQYLTVKKTSDIDLFVISDSYQKVFEIINNSELFNIVDLNNYRDYLEKVQSSKQNPEITTYKLEFNGLDVGIDILDFNTFLNLFSGNFIVDLESEINLIKRIRISSPYSSVDFDFTQPGIVEDKTYKFGPARSIVEKDDVFYSDFPAYIIENNIWYSGLYQNLLIPEFMTLFGSLRINKAINSFKSGIQDYISLHKDKVDFKGKLNLLNAHPKSKLLKLIYNT